MRTLAVLVLVSILGACGGTPDPTDAGLDSGAPVDAGSVDAGAVDANPMMDAGGGDAGATDGGTGPGDAGPDATALDAGSTDAAVSVTTFADTYDGWDESSSAVRVFDLQGLEPDTGTHPVFLYFVGTFGAHDSPSPLAWVEEMARRGFVAATIDYDNGARLGCGPTGRKAMSIFAGTSSALARLCGRARADCARGVVVAGHSQGSFIALQARDHDTRVEAALALGTGHNLRGPGFDFEACLVTDRTLPDARVRAVNGESDGTWGMFTSASPPGMIEQLNAITGQTCATTVTDCLGTGGSGWTLALDGAVSDGEAAHCYYNDASGGGMECGAPLDPVWLTTTDAWGRSAGADWLASWARP